MISLSALLLPIVLAAVFVFIVSSVIHMVFTYHDKDFKKLAREDEIMAALRQFNIPEGEYVLPHAANHKERQSPEFKEKLARGPVGFLNVFPNGEMSMGGSLAMWFGYTLLVSLFAGYIAGAALDTGAHYLQVFRFVGTAAFMGYSFALLQNTIWYRRSWAATFKAMFDGLLYALVTAGTFGWLWPQG